MNLKTMQKLKACDGDTMVVGFSDNKTVCGLSFERFGDLTPLEVLKEFRARAGHLEEQDFGKMASVGVFKDDKLVKYSDFSSDVYQEL